MSKKETLAFFLGMTGLLKVFERVKRSNKYLLTLAYHRVADYDPECYPFNEDTISATCDMFDRQMAFVSRNFDVIGFSNLKACLEHEASLPKKPLIVTFDDGYSDNYLNAFRVLKHHGLPATIFLTTGYIGTRQPFWFEKVVYWAKKTPSLQDLLGEGGVPLGGNGKATPSQLLELLKRSEDSIRIRIIDQLKSQSNAFPDEGEIDLVRPLTWEEVREMSTWGIEFGSHTVTHPILSMVSDDALRQELRDSKERIEAETGKSVIAVAYPVGKGYAVNERVFSAAKELGYTFGITYGGGIEVFDEFDRYRMKRIAVENDESFDLFRSILLVPRLFVHSL